MIERYLTVYPSGNIYWLDLERKPRFNDVYNGAAALNMDDVRKIIGCDWLEMVHTNIPGVVMMIDECGKIRQNPRLHNELASRLYGGYVPMPIDDIVGTAVFFALKPTDPLGEMDLFPLSPEQLQLVAAKMGMTLAQLLEEVQRNV